MTLPERRGDLRLPCLMVVNFTFDGKTYTEFSRDISINGLCIQSRVDLPIGGSLTLVVDPQQNKQPIKLNAKVIWTDSEQIGIQLQ